MFRAVMCPSSGDTSVNETLSICFSVWMTAWYAGAHLYLLMMRT